MAQSLDYSKIIDIQGTKAAADMERVAQQDREWFEDHPDDDIHVRPAYPSEYWQAPKAKWYVVAPSRVLGIPGVSGGLLSLPLLCSQKPTDAEAAEYLQRTISSLRRRAGK